MHSIDISQIRFRRVKVWLRQGQVIELREGKRVLARIFPEKETPSGPLEWPDFAARSYEIFKGRILSGTDLLIQERDR